MCWIGKKKISEGFGRVSDPLLRKQAIGKSNKLDAPPAAVPPPKTGTSKTDLMTSLTAIRKKGTPITKMEETELEEGGKEKVEKTMHEFKHGTLHSGSKTGPKVKSRKQAIAIALSQQRKADK